MADAHATMLHFTEQISVIQMGVIVAFHNSNIWLEPDWYYWTFYYNIQHGIFVVRSFLATMEVRIQELNTILKNCYEGIKQGLVPKYEEIQADVEICLIFDG